MNERTIIPNSDAREPVEIAINEALPASAPVANNDSAEFIKALFELTTKQRVFITSLANDRDSGERPYTLFPRDGDEITKFVLRWDRPGRALYFCTGTIKKGYSRRAKD